MFTHIRTSRSNKETVVRLTNKLNLGAENIIARIAIAVSLSSNQKLKLSDSSDSQGKEYSRAVLLGEFENIYLGMIGCFYNLSIDDLRIPKYLKLHLDHGLNILNEKDSEFELNSLFDLK